MEIVTDQLVKSELEWYIKNKDKFYILIYTEGESTYISVGDNIFPVIVNKDIGHVDDLSYSGKKNSWPVVDFDSKQYLQVNIEFLRRYMSKFNPPFEEDLGLNINTGMILTESYRDNK